MKKILALALIFLMLSPKTATAAELPTSSSFIEIPVIVGEDGDYPLNGILTLPEGAASPVPAVVLVHGSGPCDMDETVGNQTPFKDIAEYLSAHGVAVLRYDKRTKVYGKELMAAFRNDMTVFEETIEDALLAKALLEADDRIDPDRIYVLGHSMGGLLGPEICEVGGFAGLIIMSGTLRSLPEMVIGQMTYIYGLSYTESQVAELLEPYKQEFEAYRTATALTDEEAKKVTFMGTSAYYFADMDKRDQTAYLTGTEKPVLIIHGSMDYQCPADIDFAAYEALTEGMDNVTCILYPGLTHTMNKSLKTTGLGVPLDYYAKTHVAEEVLEDVTMFILSH